MTMVTVYVLCSPCTLFGFFAEDYKYTAAVIQFTTTIYNICKEINYLACSIHCVVEAEFLSIKHAAYD